MKVLINNARTNITSQAPAPLLQPSALLLIATKIPDLAGISWATSHTDIGEAIPADQQMAKIITRERPAPART